MQRLKTIRSGSTLLALPSTLGCLEESERQLLLLTVPVHILPQVARDADYLQKNVLQPAAASISGNPDKPQKFLDRVKSLRTMHSSGHSKPPSKAVSFPSGPQVQLTTILAFTPAAVHASRRHCQQSASINCMRLSGQFCLCNRRGCSHILLAASQFSNGLGQLLQIMGFCSPVQCRSGQSHIETWHVPFLAPQLKHVIGRCGLRCGAWQHDAACCAAFAQASAHYKI